MSATETNYARRYPVKELFRCNPDTDLWQNWHWQERCALKTVDALQGAFPGVPTARWQGLRTLSAFLRFKVTPHMLSLIQVDEPLAPAPNDPIWAQFVPTFADPDTRIGDFDENWELPEEMINPIVQHKYQNRINLRIQNRCLAYCMYCFEAKRVLDTASRKGAFTHSHFEDGLEYVRRNPGIEEVVISGGEPLILSNEVLGGILNQLRQIKQIKAIRIQTRALTHNPYRLDAELIDLLKRYDVTAMAFHVTHPVELNDAVEKVLDRFGDRGCRTMLLCHTPLLKGINDSVETLTNLFMRLFTLKIKPYYLLHAMPHTVGAERFRTTVRRGVELLREIKRHYTNPAVPEYVIVHAKGKHTVPMELDGTSEFQYVKGVIRFRNWKGEWCEYLDAPEIVSSPQLQRFEERQPIAACH
jgi:lysine 2,3-aminomutase